MSLKQDGMFVSTPPVVSVRASDGFWAYAATVAAATSDHGPFSPRVLTHRRA